LAKLYVPVAGCIPSRSNPLDTPLRVAVVHSVTLIIVVGRLIMVICQQGGKMRTGSASLVRSLPLHRSASPQSAFTPGLGPAHSPAMYKNCPASYRPTV